ncbi:MAG: Gfo/Idh/MocA family oxidoreductase [Planctomycetota bacterium]
MARSTRRQFLQTSLGAGVGFWVGARTAYSLPRSANEKLNLAIVGVANRGRDNLAGVRDENIVALCDIDDNYLAAAHEQFPKAKVFNDFRKLLDSDGIDAVVVSTPDHTHAPAAMGALRSGRPVYCEKPLTHTVWEARQLTNAAKETGLATQMGTQIHAGDNYRRVVEVIRSGAIGNVTEAHAWVGKGWADGRRGQGNPPVPKHIHWDLWLGPAKERPYHPSYLPANWRKHWDFGGGTLADMGCHYIDVIFWALDLDYPHKVEAEGPPVHPEGCPNALSVSWSFPGQGDRPPVKLGWHDAGRRPEAFEELGLPQWGDGVLFIGDKGHMLCDYNQYRLFPEEKFQDFQPPEQTIPQSIGHHREWIEACKTGSPTLCHFGYSGPLTETVLLGTVAYRAGTPIEWDPKTLKVKGSDKAQALIQNEYREGWSL